MTLANRITLLRFLLVPFFVGCLVYYRPEKDYLRLLALFVFFIAILTDGLDGYIARRYSQKTSLGEVLDPLADKILLASGFLSLSMLGSLPERFHIPPWLAILVISRDLFILGGSAVIYIMTQKLKVYPSRLGKTTTFFQMITLLLVLSGSPFIGFFCDVTAVFTVLSGLGYFRYGISLLNESQTPS